MKVGLNSIQGRYLSGITSILALVLFAVASMEPQSILASPMQLEVSDKPEQKESSKKKESKQSKPSSSKNAAPTAALTANAVDPNGSPIENLHATVETDPVPNANDAADDPAIWVNPSDPAQSTIIGSDKQGGIGVYDLAGKQLQYLKIGRINNVDLRPAFRLGGESVAIVAGGNRTDNSIALYKVNPKTRMLEDVAARKITTGEVYGACLYNSKKTGKHYYFVTAKSGAVEQWELMDNGSGKVEAKKVRSLKLGSVVEGCVADDELGHFYVGEEAVGIWKFGAEPDAGDARTQVDKTGAGGHLMADVEGMTIVYGENGTGYLIVSSQGNHSFVVYRREGNHEHVKTFRIAPGDDVDGTEETDGIDAVAANLGPAFPHGVFVAQDGFNDKGNQNFKLVPLERVLGKPVQSARNLGSHSGTQER
jgi:3-phytase